MNHSFFPPSLTTPLVPYNVVSRNPLSLLFCGAFILLTGSDINDALLDWGQRNRVGILEHVSHWPDMRFASEQYDWPFIQAPPRSRESTSQAVQKLLRSHSTRELCPKQKKADIDKLAEFILRKMVYKSKPSIVNILAICWLLLRLSLQKASNKNTPRICLG